MASFKGILNFIATNIQFGFNVANREAIKYFESKGLKPTFNYMDMQGDEHNKAVVVAKMMDMDMLQDVQDSITLALKKGWAYEDWSDRIIPILQANGWWGRQEVTDPSTGKTIIKKLGSPYRLKTIFRTNMQQAYMVGRWQQIMETAKERPYLRYDAIDDSRTRPQHRRWNGTILPYNHPFWRTHSPLNGYNCRCSLTQFSKEDLEAYGLEVTENPDLSTDGIDTGFDYNAGLDQWSHLQDIASQKAQNIKDEALRKAAQESLSAIQSQAKDVKSSLPYSNSNKMESNVDFRSDWGKFPDTVIIHDSGTIAEHIDYKAAKSGDLDAAIRVVDDYVTEDKLRTIKNILDKYQNVQLLPVHAEEQAGRNQLPVAFSLLLEWYLGTPINSDIVQSARVHRTGADGFARLVKSVPFQGHVTKNVNYLILDDAITQGGTIADLKGYIESNGGTVIGAAVLMGKPHSAKLAITKPTLGQLRKLVGKDLETWWYEQFGYDFSKLTESEARYIAKQVHRYGVDTVRDRLLASRLEELSRKGAADSTE